MDAKTARETALSVRAERVNVALKSNLSGIYLQIKGDSERGFLRSFIKEKIPSYILVALREQLSRDGFETDVIPIPYEYNHMHLLIKFEPPVTAQTIDIHG
jgi:hypothetical protein